jgi:hypothetical protein
VQARTDKTIECVICDCFCCCKIQEDVYKLGFKPGHLCRTQFPCDDGAIRASKRTCKGWFLHLGGCVYDGQPLLFLLNVGLSQFSAILYFRARWIYL